MIYNLHSLVSEISKSKKLALSAIGRNSIIYKLRMRLQPKNITFDPFILMVIMNLDSKDGIDNKTLTRKCRKRNEMIRQETELTGTTWNRILGTS